MAKIFWTGNERFRIIRTIGCWLEASMLRLFWWAVTPLTPDKASSIGRRLLGWIGPKTVKNRHVLANLRRVCPEKSQQELECLAKAVWGNLGAVLAEFPHLPTITNMDCPQPLIEVVCHNKTPQFLTRSKPCIFVAAHLGNWELSAFAIQTLGYPIDVVYSPLTNPFLERLLQHKRTPLDCGFITKQNALRQMLRSIKAGRSIGLHVDVRVDGGELLPFFGTETGTTTAPAWLALKTQLDIVPAHTERLENAHFRFTVHPAITTPAPTDVSPQEFIKQVTLEINRVVAAFIKKHPDQWLCTKRRWPKETTQIDDVLPQ